MAIDDALGLLVFSLLLAASQALHNVEGALTILASGARDIGGALLLGLLLGLPTAYLTGRIRPGEPSQAEALGAVMLCAGLAEWLQVSYILAAMVLGAVVVNFARHHNRPFHVIKGIEWPFLMLFFLLAGAALELVALAQVGSLAIAYMALRIVARLVGTRIGGRLFGADAATCRWMGMALLPQAGVAIGMALLAAHHFPPLKDTILPVVLASTVIFELIGPVATRWTLIHVGDIPRRRNSGNKSAP